MQRKFSSWAACCPIICYLSLRARPGYQTRSTSKKIDIRVEQHTSDVQSQPLRSAGLHSTLCVFRPAEDKVILEDVLNAYRHEPSKQ